MIDRNCLSYWFPRLARVGLPVPITRIIELSPDAAEDVYRVTMKNDGAPPPAGLGFEYLVSRMEVAADSIGYPCFIRSGHFSGKHEWRNTCCLADRANIGKQVKHIVYMGELVSMMGMPHGVWCVREYLKPGHGDVAFESEAFDGMPVRREFRCFVRGESVVCVHPYWPAGALERDLGPDKPGRSMDLLLLNEPGLALGQITRLASQAGAALGGDWSIDLLSTERGWFITDCALASQSYHWEGCPEAAAFQGATA